jgi:hypothetical protein
MKLLRGKAGYVIKKWSSYFQSKRNKVKFYSDKLLYYLRTSDASYFLVFSILTGLGQPNAGSTPVLSTLNLISICATFRKASLMAWK